jgi:N-acyl-D-aspartate/D-glutamate deacylase
MHDLLIKNALLVDGSGKPAQHGSLAVTGDRISAIALNGHGDAIGSARQEIDADGLALMPGIIDSHTHYDAQITWDQTLNPSSSLGVTTVIMGNCGFTIAPCRPEDRDITMRNLTQVEGMALDVLRSGIDWQFQSFPQYMDMLEQRGSTLNVAAFFGHSSLRTWVMGEDATKRTATADELQQMTELMTEAMQAGAIGFATSTAPQHNGHGGIPMPSRLAAEEELTAILKAMGKTGKGVFMLTKGADTSVPFLEQLAVESGRPVMVAALLHNPVLPEAIFANLADIAAAQKRGRELYGQVSCCPLTNEFTMESAYPFEGMDAWKPAMKIQGAELKALLLNPQFRQAVREELRTPVAVRLFNNEWQKLSVVEVADPKNEHFEGHTVAELAARDGKDPLDWMLDLACEENLKTLFIALLMNSDEDQVEKALCDPNASIALSDAGAHLTFFCDAGFGLHLLGHWCREKQVFSLENAAYHLTGRSADIYRIPQRGRLQTGYYADLMLFDPARIGRGASRRVFDLPGGAARLTTDAIGLHGVWVNGQQTANAEGVLPDPGRAGALLREFNR